MTVVVKLDTIGLDQIRGDLKPNAAKIIKKTAFDIEASARLYAPVDTGALANSIETIIASDGMSAVIQDGVEHGIHQELGTSKMQAQPFMTPAFEDHQQKFLSSWVDLF